MKPGHPAIEPSITLLDTYGWYNAHWKLEKEQSIWTINPFLDFQFGITENLGIEALISFVSNFQDNSTYSNFKDTILLFGYQLSNDIKNSWIPNSRLFLQGTFPSGNYQKLDPNKNGIDSTGQGSYQFGPVIALQKLFYLLNNFLSLELSFGYIIPIQTKVKGYNTYGGSFNTNGIVKPGQTIISFFSGEYSITQKWVLAFDSEFLIQGKSSFFGENGINSEGEPTSVGLPSFVQISFAPEIEYNFNSNSGLLAGLWFTVAGRNSAAFCSGFLAYLFVF